MNRILGGSAASADLVASTPAREPAVAVRTLRRVSFVNWLLSSSCSYERTFAARIASYALARNSNGRSASALRESGGPSEVPPSLKHQPTLRCLQNERSVGQDANYAAMGPSRCAD